MTDTIHDPQQLAYDHPDLADAIDVLANLVAFNTVSALSNLALIDYAEEILSAAGARCLRLPNPEGDKATLWASFGPDGDGGLVLSGHTDVVPVEGQDWSSDPLTLIERDGRLYGRGACDMKGFIACVLNRAAAFADATTPIHIALTYDEEVTCGGALALADHLAEHGPRPDLVLVGEPSDMGVVHGHKGCTEYHITVTGLEGHGSRPDLGVNAGVIAARLVAKLDQLGAQLARHDHGLGYLPPWTTLNIGRISAGHVANVIPRDAEILLEMRPVKDGEDRATIDALVAYAQHELLPSMKAVHPDADISINEVSAFPPFQPSEKNSARDLLLNKTGQNEAGLVSYCSEAGAFTRLGLDAAICGPGSILQAHKADEFVSRAELARCLHLLDRLAVWACR